ncbi:MAG: PHP domain-containing protein, partial [Methyloprofundus sp.]|nr:PHP domain-containing protein [Methyloprofundus sp.]
MNEIKYDLHCHSSASDGALSPSEVVLRAKEHGVTTLALTDHDTVAGLGQARQTAIENDLKLISGIELSCTWNKRTFHILGLDIDPDNAELLEGIQALQNTRLERAYKIAHKLEKNKIPGAFDAVLEAAGSGMITRSHFANFLLKHSYVSTMQGAFDHYLGRSKPRSEEHT